MKSRWVMLAAFTILCASGCSKSVPLTTGTNAYKVKDGVWVSYGWSKSRLSYILYFVPSTTFAFSEDAVAARVKYTKEADTFEGSFDGYADKSKAPYKIDAKAGLVTLDGKSYRTSNGAVFLVNVGPPTKVVQLIVPLIATGPKNPEEMADFMETEVKRVTNDNPKIKAFPQEPPPEKPPAKKK